MLNINLTARKNDPSTSQEALEALGASSISDKILDTLNGFGNQGATSSQLALVMGKNRDSISPCIAKLRKEGLIRYSGSVRKTGNNRKQMVWVPVHTAYIGMHDDEERPIRQKKGAWSSETSDNLDCSKFFIARFKRKYHYVYLIKMGYTLLSEMDSGVLPDDTEWAEIPR